MTLEVHQSISDFKLEEWNSLVDPAFPFCYYEFISALENNDCLGKRTGWYPCYISTKDNGKLVGIFILYLKTNSYGEYIFDWAWANAWQQSGLDYYPKLTSAIPFTPATGSKFLCHPEYNRQDIYHLNLKEIHKLSVKSGASSSHILFNPETEITPAASLGFIPRKTYQFHWFNDDYQHFDDFLAKLKQKKRQKVRRERKAISENSDILIKEVTGESLSSKGALFYELYISTIDKKMSYDYLTKGFFEEIFKSLSDKLLLYLALRDDEVIAGSLNFLGQGKLYGRYWGAFEDLKHLHFELCYYRPIEYAIKNKMTIFEAGAQGEHKIQRGFIPAATHSLHMLPKHELSQLVKQSIQKENAYAEKLISEGRSFVYK